jgi:hypothetical protein
MKAPPVAPFIDPVQVADAQAHLAGVKVSVRRLWAVVVQNDRLYDKVAEALEAAEVDLPAGDAAPPVAPTRVARVIKIEEAASSSSSSSDGRAVADNGLESDEDQDTKFVFAEHIEVPTLMDAEIF